MIKVPIQLPHHGYDVCIGAGLLDQAGELVQSVAPHRRAALFVDGAVLEPHGKKLTASLETAGFAPLVRQVRAGEAAKNLDQVRELYDVLLDGHFERKSPVLAMGGGVVGDTIGFVAATYLRGVPFVQCPTTLLAMVDAAVGGKVGVNVPQGKNLVGAFYQPHAVIIDTHTLSTLPDRELRCGLAECVKHGVIRDPELFQWIADHVDKILTRDSETLVELVARNVRIKAAVVIADEKEAGQRAHLNFGHTFAHAIEATCGYDNAAGYHHGEAVSLGMVAATKLAVQAGRCPAGVLTDLTRLLSRIGLPVTSDRLAATEDLMAAMRLDKKVKDNAIRLVLPDDMGRVSVVSDTPAEAIQAAWDALGVQ